MTAAFNLSQLANNLNTSGQLDATDGLSGLVAVANLASTGTPSASTYLRGDRTWATIPLKVLQIVSRSTTTFSSSTSSTYVDATDVYVTITPTSSSSKIYFILNSYVLLNTGDVITCWGRITRNGTQVYVASPLASYNVNAAMNNQIPFSIIFMDAPASTSALTYQFQFQRNAFAGSYGGDCYINSGGNTSTITAFEVVA
jgi:hypothetical protein